MNTRDGISKKQSKDGTLLSLDIGTGTVRAVLFDLRGTIVGKTSEARHYLPDPYGEPFQEVFDDAALWSTICSLIAGLLESTDTRSESVLAVSVTGQRLSFLFLDKAGDVLYAGPNMDARGLHTQAEIEERLGEERIHPLTGQWPTMLSALARLLWFRHEAPEVFARIRKVLMLNDWVQYRLTGEMASEPTSASVSLFLDLSTRQWSNEVLSAFDFNRDLLPPLVSAGDVAGRVHAAASADTGLAEGTPVVVSGGDTQCALAWAGLDKPDQFGIVAGTTALVCRTVDSPLVDPGRCTWTSCHLGANRWMVEANGQWAGTVYQWLGDLFGGYLEEEIPRAEIYARMEDRAARVSPGSDDTYAFLGPVIMDAENLHHLRPGMFLFPPPAHPMVESPATAGRLVRSTLENIAFAICANYEQLLPLKPAEPDRVFITGGLCASRLFCRIVADCLGLPLHVGRVLEGSALGAAVCAAAGAGVFRSLGDAQQGLCGVREVFEPDGETRSVYAESYERWLELYNKILDL
ncbi:FGGY-family carbohydrate kinase [Thermodesulfobacteriota bacterium]